MFDFPVAIPLMRRAIYPGSFDPVTNGHLDVIKRARKLFDEVIVAVAHNDEKQPLFSLKERLDLLRETAGKIDSVRIAELKGLLVEFAKTEKAGAVIRGLRAVSDFEFEFQMALMNRKLETGVETIFLMPKEEYTYLSSRIVSGEIRARSSGAGICGAHGAARAGDDRSYAIHARRCFAESAGAPALRSRCWPNL